MIVKETFDAVLEEACRQWCCCIDECPERKDGEGFAAFFHEIFADKYEEYLHELSLNENGAE